MAAKQTLPRIERLTEQLSGQAQAQGLEPHLILPPAAATVMLLGSGDLYTPILEGLAASADPVGLLGQLFGAQAACLPYLAGQLDPLTSIMTRSSHPDRVNRAIRGMFNVLARTDLHQLLETPAVAGDLLGPLHTLITCKAARSSRGAFYTPPSLGALLAALGDVRPGESFSDPCCGTGGLAIAMIRGMRADRQVPELVRWHLQDIDPLAVALAGVQLAAHGMPLVHLVCGNSLTDRPHGPDRV